MEQKIRDKYPNIYRGAGEGSSIARKLSGIIDGYGWLNSIYEIAKDGLFSRGWKETPIESVENTGVWEVLTYMSWKAAQTEYKSKYQELAYKQQKQKQ